jgi:hypothetical protein
MSALNLLGLQIGDRLLLMKNFLYQDCGIEKKHSQSPVKQTPISKTFLSVKSIFKN